MQTAPPTPDETERLALLRTLQLLDTPPEPAFDAITAMLARMLDVPIALVSLVDAQRQWFKSRVGLQVTETPRALAFCAHAIHGSDVFVVPDAQADVRFQDNPLVTAAPHVRAYAGYPLRSTDGHAIGTLCAIDRVPRRFSDDELALLRAFGEIVRREVLHRETALRAQALADRTLHTVSQSEALYHATFDNAAIGMAIVALDGQWLKINPALCQILGRAADELALLSFQDLTHPDDLDLDLGRVRQLMEGACSHYTLEKRYLRPDGSTVWANLTVRLVRQDGVPQHFISVVEDISARREAEQALHQLRQDLEQRVAARTTELRAANAYLSEAVRQRQESEAALARSEADMRAVLEQAHDAFISIDTTGTVVAWNRQAAANFGWRPDEAIGRRLDTLIVPPAHRSGYRLGLQRLAADAPGALPNQRMELPVQCRDGRVIPCEVTLSTLASATRGRVYAAFLHDITLRKAAEQAMATHNRELQLMLDNEMVGMVRLRERRTVWTNRGLERIFGWGPGELDGQPARLLYADDDSFFALGAAAYPVLRAGGTYRTQLRMRRKDGAPVWIDLSGVQLDEASGESMWLMADINALKQQQDAVEQLAFRDALTGLPNRLLLQERLAQALRLGADKGLLVAVAFLDLDGFKAVNDREGHEAGDRLLRTIATRLAHCVRRNDTVARLGGDEFVLVLAALASRAECTVILERALALVAEPVDLGGGRIGQVSCSIGLALCPDDARDAEAALAWADRQMYRAKQAGKNSIAGLQPV